MWQGSDQLVLSRGEGRVCGMSAGATVVLCLSDHNVWQQEENKSLVLVMFFCCCRQTYSWAKQLLKQRLSKRIIPSFFIVHCLWQELPSLFFCVFFWFFLKKDLVLLSVLLQAIEKKTLKPQQQSTIAAFWPQMYVIPWWLTKKR